MRIPFFAICAFIFIHASAQRSVSKHHEIFGGVGTSNYFGDIGGSTGESFLGLNDLDLASTRFSAQGGYRYIINDRMAVKLNAFYGLLSGDDTFGGNETRALKFNTNLLEISSSYEYYLVPYKIKEPPGYEIMQLRSGYNHVRFQARPYLFAGLGGIHFTPTILNNPQNRGVVTDRNFSGVFLAGIGAKIEINFFSFMAEFGGRLAFTDYIDGYSPASDPVTNYDVENFDIYYLVTFSATYTLNLEKWIKKLIN